MSAETNTRSGKTSYFYTVDKETCLLVGWGTTFAMDFRSPSEKMTMSSEMRFIFSDYGKDFPVQVPQEARDAEYLPPGTSMDL